MENLVIPRIGKLFDRLEYLFFFSFCKISYKDERIQKKRDEAFQYFKDWMHDGSYASSNWMGVFGYLGREPIIENWKHLDAFRWRIWKIVEEYNEKLFPNLEQEETVEFLFKQISSHQSYYLLREIFVKKEVFRLISFPVLSEGKDVRKTYLAKLERDYQFVLHDLLVIVRQMALVYELVGHSEDLFIQSYKSVNAELFNLNDLSLIRIRQRWLKTFPDLFRSYQESGYIESSGNARKRQSVLETFFILGKTFRHFSLYWPELEGVKKLRGNFDKYLLSFFNINDTEQLFKMIY